MKTKVESLEGMLSKRLINLSSCNEARRDGLKALTVGNGTMEQVQISLEEWRKFRMNALFKELGLRLRDEVNDRDSKFTNLECEGIRSKNESGADGDGGSRGQTHTTTQSRPGLSPEFVNGHKAMDLPNTKSIGKDHESKSNTVPSFSALLSLLDEHATAAGDGCPPVSITVKTGERMIRDAAHLFELNLYLDEKLRRTSFAKRLRPAEKAVMVESLVVFCDGLLPQFAGIGGELEEELNITSEALIEWFSFLVTSNLGKAKSTQKIFKLFKKLLKKFSKISPYTQKKGLLSKIFGIRGGAKLDQNSRIDFLKENIRLQTNHSVQLDQEIVKAKNLHDQLCGLINSLEEEVAGLGQLIPAEKEEPGHEVMVLEEHEGQVYSLPAGPPEVSADPTPVLTVKEELEEVELDLCRASIRREAHPEPFLLAEPAEAEVKVKNDIYEERDPQISILKYEIEARKNLLQEMKLNASSDAEKGQDRRVLKLNASSDAEKGQDRRVLKLKNEVEEIELEVERRRAALFRLAGSGSADEKIHESFFEDSGYNSAH